MCPTAALRANSLTTPTSLRSSPLLNQEGSLIQQTDSSSLTAAAKTPLLIQEGLPWGWLGCWPTYKKN